MDKRLSLQLNGSRRVTGILRGYDPFMNVVLDDTIEEVSATEKHNIGMVVSSSIPTQSFSFVNLTDSFAIFSQVIRGNSIVILEALERIS
jgi:small nuclear ribonucleoprotein G